MKQNRKHITVFEHQSLKLHQKVDGVEFTSSKLKALQNYYGDAGVPYFSLIHNGVRFNEYVGVIQVGDLVIEVLPKADKSTTGPGEEAKWRGILIDMLRAVGVIKIHSVSNSNLKLKSNSVLDLYFELFIKEVEYLLHNGLVKQYRKKEGNVSALKGSLQFGKHIQQNLVHKERFYVRHSTYDVTHHLHVILYKTIRLLKQINTNATLHSRIGALLLHFPEMPDVKVNDTTFEKIIFSRKTQSYKTAIDIARLLLLQYHPDVTRGRNNVLALMFDMNQLWEAFVYSCLRRDRKHHFKVTAQTSKDFWKPTNGRFSRIRPDLLLNEGTDQCVVLDTKWKNLNGAHPSPDDLRQMYVYCNYYQAKKVALVYPASSTKTISGVYKNPDGSDLEYKGCSVISLSVVPGIRDWQRVIYDEIAEWVGKTEVI